jgi:hypothetical protein
MEITELQPNSSETGASKEPPPFQEETNFEVLEQTDSVHHK